MDPHDSHGNACGVGATYKHPMLYWINPAGKSSVRVCIAECPD
jgi:hypothetical protein